MSISIPLSFWRSVFESVFRLMDFSNDSQFVIVFFNIADVRSSFLSNISDRSTDTFSKETEVVYIKTCVNCEVRHIINILK